MRKFSIFVFVCFCLFFYSWAWSIDPSNADWKLKFLLNDETLPFYPDTVRHTFIDNAMEKISATCKYAATAKGEGYILPGDFNTSILWNFHPGVISITEILGVKLKDEDYGLQRIQKRDLGLKKIATDQAVRYWYITDWVAVEAWMGVYNAVTESTAVDIYYSGIADWDSCRAFQPFFENEVALYALYLAKLRKGETEIARFIRQIAINEILDLKVILEGRSVDITIEKEVMPR